MPHRDPIEFTGKVLDQRNDLTGPEAGAENYPKRPKNVPIQEPNSKNNRQ
ncbi:hypothetical protein [Bacillus sp. MUM 116]|nr:hypothetical protein [Bacillus sp. MUM 116]